MTEPDAGAPGRVAVIGLGNVLMGDDALGPYAVRVLQAGWEFPPGVSVTDAGTPGLDLTPYILGVEALIVVDTVKADAPPGTLRLYRKDELLATPPAQRLSRTTRASRKRCCCSTSAVTRRATCCSSGSCRSTSARRCG